MSYASQQDMVDRFGEQDLIRLTNRMASLTAIDSAVLQTRLDDATAMINGYIEKRVTLPFDEVPRILVKVCCDLAYYDLLGGQGASLEQAKARYDDSVQFLKAVAKGQASLGDETPEDIESSSPGPAIIEGDDPTFSRDSLKGF